MKIQVLGVKRIKGIAKATGNEFDMCHVYGMVPIEAGGGGKVVVSGFGFEVAEMRLDPECLPEFAKVKLPALLDLKTDMTPFMGKFETIVIGFEVVPAVKGA